MIDSCKLGSKCLQCGEELEACGVEKCQNVIHLSCFAFLWPMFREEERRGPIFCGKYCYNHMKKTLITAPTSQNKQIPWHNDGPNAEINSMAVLIDWLTTPNNYNRWHRGDKHNGATKSAITNEISQLIKEKGITVERTGNYIIYLIFQKVLIR